MLGVVGDEVEVVEVVVVEVFVDDEGEEEGVNLGGVFGVGVEGDGRGVGVDVD